MPWGENILQRRSRRHFREISRHYLRPSPSGLFPPVHFGRKSRRKYKRGVTILMRLTYSDKHCGKECQRHASDDMHRDSFFLRLVCNALHFLRLTKRAFRKDTADLYIPILKYAVKLRGKQSASEQSRPISCVLQGLFRLVTMRATTLLEPCECQDSF